jgi:hypothetical protein
MRRILPWTSIAIGGSGILITLALTFRFFLVACGAHIRPAGWAAVIVVLSCLALVAGIPPAVYALFASRRKLAVVGLGLSVLPYPLSIAMIRVASAVCGFTLVK